MEVTVSVLVESFPCTETWFHVRLDVDDTLYPVSSGFSDHRNGEAPGVMLGPFALAGLTFRHPLTH